MNRQCTILAMIVAFAVLLLGNNMIAAQDDSQFKPLENAEQQSAGSKEQEDYGEDAQEGIGYHPEGRQVGTPIDVDQDLDNSFPKRDHLLPRLLPKAWFQWKEDLYEKYNLKLGISYQAIYQHASSTTPNGDNEVAAGWALLEGKWTAFNRDKNFEGSIVATLDSRHPYTDGNAPTSWGFADAGSLWPTDFVYEDWDTWVPVAYYEQWFTKTVS